MAPQDKTRYESSSLQDADANTANINGKLVNPFKGLRHEQMSDKIKEFMMKTEIDEMWVELIRKGAFLAQDGEAFSHPRTDSLQLKPDERRALQQEDPKTGNKWNQPWIMYALVGCCSLGAAVQGWDETAVNGAQLFYQDAYGIDGSDGHNPGIRGLVNSAPYLCCAVLGCWLTEPLNRLLGRRGTIFVTCILSSLTCVWQAFTNTWWHLFIARFCLGLGVGPKSATIPIYSAECVPANIRGALVMMWQMWTAFGIMLGYIAGVVFRGVLSGDSTTCTNYNANPPPDLLGLECSLNWRLMLASPMVLPLIAAAYVFTLPESPRWLLLKARQGKIAYYDKAFRSLCKLRHSKLQAARDLFLIHHLLDGEEDIKKGHNRFIELWSVARNRRALVASLTVMFLQQICGVNVMAFYSSEVLSKVFGGGTRGDKKALLGSLGFGILNFVFALPAVYTIDTFGRRNLLLCTFPFLALFQLFTSIGSLSRFQDHSATQTGLILTGMYMFSVFYSPGEGPVPFVYSAESMPLYVRDIGMSMATATLWFFNFLLAVTFPNFQVAFTDSGAFGWYAAWCVVGWFMILFLVYETKDLTLEQLDARFSIPTKTHAVWAMNDAVWVFRYYFLMRRGEKRPVLSVWTEGEGSEIGERPAPRKLSMEIVQREISGIDN